MKTLVVGNYGHEVISQINQSIDGSIYTEEARSQAFHDLINGVFFSPNYLDYDGPTIVAEGLAKKPTDISITDGDNKYIVKQIRRAILQLTPKRVSVDIAFPDEIRQYVVTPKQVPREVICGPIKTQDFTPYCMFPNPVFDFANSPVQITSEIMDLAKEKGVKTVLPQRDVAVTKYAHQHWKELEKTQIEGKLKIPPHYIPETACGVMLPLRGFKDSEGKENLTGMDFLPYGHPLYLKFTRKLAQLRRERAETNRVNKADAIDHAIFMRQDYSSWTPTVQEIYADSAYKCELEGLELDCFHAFLNDMESYYSFIEQNMLVMFAEKPDAFKMSTKPLKSPGTDVVQPDGILYKKGDHYYYPNEGFDTGNPEKNAYAKFTYEPLKRSLEPLIVPSVEHRMEGLKQGKLHDPTWEFDMVMDGCAREGTIAWRINNPDATKPVIPKTGDIHNTIIEYETQDIDKLPDIGDDDAWRTFQGKPREISCHPDFDTYYTVKIHPYQVALLIKEKQDHLLHNGGYKMTRQGKSCVAYPFRKDDSLLRARIICPHKWRFNMFDGTIAKFFALPIEHCARGFPSLKVGSLYEQHYRPRVNKTAVVPWALDVSHFETFCSAQEWTPKLFGGNNVRRALYFEDAASGWIASALGRRYHGFQTSSGIGHTSLHSLIVGMFLCSVDIMYRDDNPTVEIAQTAWRGILQEACAYAIQHFGAKSPNPFGDISIPHPVYHINGKEVEVLNGAGSDDEGGWDQSDTATVSEIEQRLNSPAVTKWREKSHMSIELGEGAHFGIVRTTSGFRKDETSADWKWTFMERKSIGDLIALGIVEAFKQTPGLEEDVQAALDFIQGGSTKSYWLGAKTAECVLRSSKDFCNQLVEANYPEESPKGRVMSEALEQYGFDPSLSHKLTDDTTKSIITCYLNFIKI